MIFQQRSISSFLPLVAALAAAALTGCVLDMSTKDSCEGDDDCIDGYSCTRANVCEATITLGPDATSGHDATPFYPDAAVVEDGGTYYPDAQVEDGGTYYPDAQVEDGGTYYPDAQVDDGGTYYPDAAGR